MGGGSEDPKMKVTEYYIAAHYGVCMGPVDEVTEVWYGEKKLLAQSISQNTGVYINKENLFGGEKVEGGFRGGIDFMLGGPAQTIPPALAASLVRNDMSPAYSDSGKFPAYRGILSFYIRGPLGTWDGWD